MIPRTEFLRKIAPGCPCPPRGRRQRGTRASSFRRGPLTKRRDRVPNNSQLGYDVHIEQIHQSNSTEFDTGSRSGEGSKPLGVWARWCSSKKAYRTDTAEGFSVRRLVTGHRDQFLHNVPLGAEPNSQISASHSIALAEFLNDGLMPVHAGSERTREPARVHTQRDSDWTGFWRP